jgi:lipopolysaccharide/colanic/teichoic acid biosynthesis glycosyltransferase
MARIIERLINVGVASLALVFLAPVLLFLAVAVYLVDGRPLLVSEDWIDRRGRRTTLLAFRTKRVRFNSNGDRMALPWIGWYLRRSSLDKLPRCWNLLRGDCNLDAFWF